jgi:hypothetical protein
MICKANEEPSVTMDDKKQIENFLFNFEKTLDADKEPSVIMDDIKLY